MRIKDLSCDNRPLERLESLGVEALSNAELVALIIKTGHKTENAVDIAHQLLSVYGLEKISYCSLTELQSIKGIGRVKACQLHAVVELSNRFHKVKKKGTIITSAQDVFEYVSPKFSSLDTEHFLILHLDSKQRLIKEHTVSIGILNASLIHPREVFKSAIKDNAHSIIIVHNHPSGDPTPSQEDKEITGRLIQSGELLDIPVLDHVIIGWTEYYSFKEVEQTKISKTELLQ